MNVQTLLREARTITFLSLRVQGEGVSRSPSTAMNYFSAANGIGPWSGWLRRGLDQYLLGNYQQSVLCYVMGGELGECCC